VVALSPFPGRAVLPASLVFPASPALARVRSAPARPRCAGSQPARAAPSHASPGAWRARAAPVAAARVDWLQSPRSDAGPQVFRGKVVHVRHWTWSGAQPGLVCPARSRGHDIGTSPARALPSAATRSVPGIQHRVPCLGHWASDRQPCWRSAAARCRPGARPLVPGPASARHWPVLLLDLGLPSNRGPDEGRPLRSPDRGQVAGRAVSDDPEPFRQSHRPRRRVLDTGTRDHVLRARAGRVRVRLVADDATPARLRRRGRPHRCPPPLSRP